MRRLIVLFALSVSISLAIPATTQAGTVKFVSCMVGGATAPWLTDKLNAGINKITDYAQGVLTKLLKDKLKDKLGSTIGGMSKVPVQDSDVKNATDKAKTDIISNVNSKELWADTIARCGAREILNKISGDIVNTARTSGRD